MSDIDLTVELESLTPAQALALEQFFEEWTYAGMGRSRHISFFVDGDGNFNPSIQTEIHGEVPELDEDTLKKAKIDEHGSLIKFDFDPLAWEMRDERD